MKAFSVNKHLITIYIVIFSLALVLFGVYQWNNCDNGICDYKPSRDKAAIKKMFHDDWKFLYYGDWDKISEDDYNVDFMLDHRSASQHSAQNNLILKVLRDSGKTVGFLAYYPKSAHWWHMLFLITDVDYRRKGGAARLIDWMIKDMVARGAIKITTFTRLANVRARGLYEGKFGFKDIGHPDDKYLDLVLYPGKK